MCMGLGTICIVAYLKATKYAVAQPLKGNVKDNRL